MLVGHLLNAKKKHDETKNVESEEVEHLQKGADYLTTLLLQQGIQQTPKTVSANKITASLRSYKTPIISRIEADQVILDARTVLPAQDDIVIQALKELTI